jgi:DNA primase
MSDFETVKQRADIVDVVGSYVALQRAGRYFKACCPFHNEKTPSFYVYPERQSWHCFGACATGGDVFTFLEKKENLTPVEALRLLAERYGVMLERRDRKEAETATARLIEANEAAAQYFHSLLLNAAAGAPGRAYLEKRGLDAETVRAFQLGYSAEVWDGLRDHLRGRGFSDDEQVEAGLLTRGDRGVYDRFRGRLMFPIRDERGRVIGFGGRVLGDGTPKYLNTPQTPLFDKGATLFALDRAKDAIRAAGVVVVVEGYMDAITAHQHGIANVVATLGTALTERHVALLKRYARQVVLAMDADTAGIEAALRGEELVRKAAEADPDAPARVVVDWRSLVRVQATAPVEVRVFTVPQGKDPDEAIRADPDAFRELVSRAVPPFEFRLRHELAAIDRESPRERRALAGRLLPLVAAIADRAVQAQYLAQLAQATAIPEEVLAAEMRAAAGRSTRLPLREPVQPSVPSRERGPDAPASPEAGTHPPAPSPKAGPLPPSPSPPISGEGADLGGGGQSGGRSGWGVRAEITCLRLLLAYEGLRDVGMALVPDLFTDPANRALLLAWKAWPPPTLGETLDEAGREHLTRVLAERIPPYDEATAARAFADLVARLRLRLLDDRARLLAGAVREAGIDAAGEVVSRALAALVNDTTDDAADDSVASRWLKGVEVAQDRHALEAGLRARAPAPGDQG